MAKALALNASEFVKLAKQDKYDLFPWIVNDRDVYVETYDHVVLHNGVPHEFKVLPTRREKIPINPEDPGQIGKHTIDWLSDQTRRDFYTYLDQVKRPSVLNIRLSIDVWPVLFDKLLEDVSYTRNGPLLHEDFTPQSWQKYPNRLKSMFYADRVGGELNAIATVILQASYPPGLTLKRDQKDQPDVILTATGPFVKSIASTIFDTMVEVMTKHSEMVKKEYVEYNAAVRNVLDVIFALK